MVISSVSEQRRVMQAIEAGASGYLLKGTEAPTVPDAVLELLAGGSPISASVARHLLQKLQEPAPDKPTTKLTERESEVLTLAAKGLTNGEIAEALGMSYHTVTTHTRHIYRKLSSRSRTEAVFEALRQGLIRITGS
jgi:DNA-binding NarL/FixJ family response regulator